MVVSNRKVRIFCLDVGQGDCTFVLRPDRPPILFDCKDAHVAKMFVRFHGITRISAIVFSHLDIDHIAGGQQFIEDFLADGGTIGNVFLDADREVHRRDPGAKTAKELIDLVCKRAGERKLKLLTPRGDPAEVDREPQGACSVRIIGPRQDIPLRVARGDLVDEPNVHSAVLRVEFGGKAVTIGADAPLVSWAAIEHTDLPAAAFRIPHHGGALDDGGPSPGWSAQHLYDMVGPQVGVISVGTRNPYDHPHPDWVRPLLSRTGCHTVCTQVTPRCEPRVAEDDPALVYRDRILRQAWAEEAAPAWRHRPDGRHRRDEPSRHEVPCAGSIAIILHEDGEVHWIPEPGSSHKAPTLFERPWCKHGPPL